MKYLIALSIVGVMISCENKTNNRKAADDIAEKAGKPTNMNAGVRQYQLAVPEGWTTKTQTNYGVNYLYLLAPKTAEDSNTNINVATEYMQDLSMADYRKQTIESILTAIPSAKIVGQGEIASKAAPGLWYSYSMNPRNINATIVGYIFPKDGIAYNITAGTQTNDADRYRPLFDSVARSFEFVE